jgi:cytochrome c553
MRSILVATVLLHAAPGTAAEAPPSRPAQLGLCASCHGDEGRTGTPGTPRLAGQDPLYLREALGAYRDGRRDHAAMRAIAGALDAADIAALADWYAKQPARAP